MPMRNKQQRFRIFPFRQTKSYTFTMNNADPFRPSETSAQDRATTNWGVGQVHRTARFGATTQRAGAGCMAEPARSAPPTF